MAGSYWDPNYAQNRREMLASIRPTSSSQVLSSMRSGGNFGAQQSALDQLFALKTQQALDQSARRADQLSAARGMHIDGGQNIQAEQELANDALGQINAQHAGALVDLLSRQQEYNYQMQQAEEDRRRYEIERQRQAELDRQSQQQLYASMRGEAPRSSYNPFGSLFDGQSSTGSVIGDPAVSSSNFGTSNLKPSTKRPDRVFTETKDDVAARTAAAQKNVPLPGQPSNPGAMPANIYQPGMAWANKAATAPPPNQMAGTSASFMRR